jgi:hypothetical protein
VFLGDDCSPLHHLESDININQHFYDIDYVRRRAPYCHDRRAYSTVR